MLLFSMGDDYLPTSHPRKNFVVSQIVVVGSKYALISSIPRSLVLSQSPSYGGKDM